MRSIISIRRKHKYLGNAAVSNNELKQLIEVARKLCLFMKKSINNHRAGKANVLLTCARFFVCLCTCWRVRAESIGAGLSVNPG